MKISTLVKSSIAVAALTASASASAQVAMLATAEPSAQEQNAIDWFKATYPGSAISSDFADLKDAKVIWVNVDRCGLAQGKDNLPSEVLAAVDDLKAFYTDGGNLYVSKMALQLCEDLGFVPEGKNPTIFGSPEGNVGGDVWYLMPKLGWIFREEGPQAGAQGYYDRSNHPIYADVTTEDEDKARIGLVGAEFREDHNCMWDANIYGAGDEADVIANFEKATDSKVLATWGHVEDHCVVGAVEFLPNESRKGVALGMGLAAYQWQPESEYYANVGKLTSNILNYLDSESAAVENFEIEGNEAPVYYNVQGVQVANPEKGLYIRVANGKASKILVK